MRWDRKPEPGGKACSEAMDSPPLWQSVLDQLSEAKALPQSSLPSRLPVRARPKEICTGGRAEVKGSQYKTPGATAAPTGDLRARLV